jgi:hypothetical protein
MAEWIEIMDPEEGEVIRAPLAVTADKVETVMGEVHGLTNRAHDRIV